MTTALTPPARSTGRRWAKAGVLRWPGRVGGVAAVVGRDVPWHGVGGLGGRPDDRAPADGVPDRLSGFSRGGPALAGSRRVRALALDRDTRPGPELGPPGRRRRRAARPLRAPRRHGCRSVVVAGPSIAVAGPGATDSAIHPLLARVGAGA